MCIICVSVFSDAKSVAERLFYEDTLLTALFRQILFCFALIFFLMLFLLKLKFLKIQVSNFFLFFNFCFLKNRRYSSYFKKNKKI